MQYAFSLSQTKRSVFRAVIILAGRIKFYIQVQELTACHINKTFDTFHANKGSRR